MMSPGTQHPIQWRVLSAVEPPCLLGEGGGGTDQHIVLCFVSNHTVYKPNMSFTCVYVTCWPGTVDNHAILRRHSIAYIVLYIVDVKLTSADQWLDR